MDACDDTARGDVADVTQHRIGDSVRMAISDTYQASGAVAFEVHVAMRPFREAADIWDAACEATLNGTV